VISYAFSATRCTNRKKRVAAPAKENVMAKKPEYAPYVVSENAIAGFSSIAPGFWRTAEKLRDQAEKETAKLAWRTHWSIHSTICLYHAALDCFINEEITLREVLLGSGPTAAGQKIQSNTSNTVKVDEFYFHCGLAGRLSQEVKRRVLLLINLRNRLAHHWPELRDVRDYPVAVIDALADAKIERINTSWTAQCSDVRVAKWAAEVLRAFVDEWWQVGRKPPDIERLGWEYGPNMVYPSQQATAG
jgi:hypothetical protein